MLETLKLGREVRQEKGSVAEEERIVTYASRVDNCWAFSYFVSAGGWRSCVSCFFGTKVDWEEMGIVLI